MIEQQLYREQLLERARNPTHYGELKGCTIKKRDTNPLCGDEVTIMATINHNKITALRFTGKGCALSTAATSLLCEHAEGKPIKSAVKLQRKDMEELLGATVSISRVKCIMLGVIALKKGIVEWESKHV